MMRTWNILAYRPCLAGFLILASLSHAGAQTSRSAQDIGADAAPSGDDVHIIVSPYVWGASLGGDVALAGFGAPVHLPFSNVLDHLDAVAMGNVEIVQGRMGTYVDAQYVKTSQQEQVLSLPVDLTVKITRISGGIFYKALLLPIGMETGSGKRRMVSIEPTAGLRWTQLAIRASSPLLGTRKKARWADPFVGLRVNADISRHWNLAAEADVGGFGASSTISVNAQSYIGYRLSLARQPAVLRVGYRYLKQDYSRPDFTSLGRFVWDTEQKGPVVGISVIF